MHARQMQGYPAAPPFLALPQRPRRRWARARGPTGLRAGLAGRATLTKFLMASLIDVCTPTTQRVAPGGGHVSAGQRVGHRRGRGHARRCLRPLPLHPARRASAGPVCANNRGSASERPGPVWTEHKVRATCRQTRARRAPWSGKPLERGRPPASCCASHRRAVASRGEWSRQIVKSCARKLKTPSLFTRVYAAWTAADRARRHVLLPAIGAQDLTQ